VSKNAEIKPLQTLKNTKFSWARQVPTFPVYHLLVGSLSALDGPSTDKLLKEALHVDCGRLKNANYIFEDKS
jgi:hypothetical protein